MAVPAPADRRFRRAHLRPARRRSWRPSWRALVRAAALGAVASYGCYHAVHFALASEALTVTQISLRGDARMARGEVLALLDELQGANLVTLDLEHWRRQLLGSPWVADATLRRALPGTVSVVVAERQPMGIARMGDSLYLIDHRGTIIDEFGPNHADFDLPIIDGLDAGTPAGRTRIDESRAALVARFVAHLQRRPDLARRVSQIDVTNARDAAVLLKGDTTFVRVGDDRFGDRLQSYLDLQPALRERIADIDYVDLRFDDRVYVRPQNARSTTRQGQGAAANSRNRSRGTTGGD